MFSPGIKCHDVSSFTCLTCTLVSPVSIPGLCLTHRTVRLPLSLFFFLCFSLSFSLKLTHLLSLGHQCLSSDNEYCFCLCKHIIFILFFILMKCGFMCVCVCVCVVDGLLHISVACLGGWKKHAGIDLCLYLCVCVCVFRPASLFIVQSLWAAHLLNI